MRFGCVGGDDVGGGKGVEGGGMRELVIGVIWRLLSGLWLLV